MTFTKGIYIILIVSLILLFMMVGYELSQKKFTSENSTVKNHKYQTAVSQSNQIATPDGSVGSSHGEITQNTPEEVVTPSEKVQEYSYYPATVTLEGVVRKLVGEYPDQEKKITYFVLELDNPINVKGNPNDPDGNMDSFENVTQLQFFTQGKAMKDIRNLIDKRVIVQGQLFQGLAFPSFTDVGIQTRQIKQIITENSSNMNNQRTNSQNTVKLENKNSSQDKSSSESQFKDLDQAEDRQCYSYDTQIELNGFIQEKSGYGPPNYGETPEEDQKITYYVLALNKPLDVQGDPNDFGNEESFEKIKYIQITILSDDDLHKVEKLVGKYVSVRCKLYQKSIAADYTDVILQFTDIIPK